MAALNQTVRLQIETLVSGIQNLTSLGGTLNTLKAAAAGVAGALFVDQISAMVQESNKANLNLALFSRTMAIYGQNVDEARKKTDDFAVGMGISRNVMQENISQLVKLGLSVEQSIQLTEATLDTAAAMGTTAESAMNSLQSSMVTGMSIYLNNIGIIENFDVSLNQMAETLGKNVKQLTDSERAQAQMNHIMKFAAQDAGTYSSQMSGIVGVMAQYDSKMRDVRRTIGEAMTPAWEEAWQFMLLNITSLKDWMVEGDKLEKLGSKIAKGVKWAADEINHMKEEAKVFEPALKSLSGAFGNIITFLTRFVTKTTEVEKGTDPMNDAFEAMADIINPIADGFENLTAKLEDLEPYFGDIENALKGAAVAWLGYRTGALLAAAATTIVTLAMSPILVPILALTAAVAVLYLAWKYNFGGIREVVDDAWKTLKTWWKNIQGVFDSLKNYLSKALPEAWENLKKYFAQRLDESPFVKSLKLIPGLFEGVLGSMAKLKDKAVEFWNMIKREFKEDFNDYDANTPEVEGGERYTGAQNIADLATRNSATLNRDNLYGKNAGKYGYGTAGHDGYDFGVGASGMRANERVYAPFSGMASLVDSGKAGYGKHVKLVDDLGQTLILAHLKAFDKDLADAFAKAKNKPIFVRQGTLFGQEGSSGNSTGPHVHLGALDKSRKLSDLDQMTFQSMATPTDGRPVYNDRGYTTGSGERDDFGNRTENAAGSAAVATKEEEARQAAALKVAEGYAKRQVALMREAELAKTDEQRKNIADRLALLKKEVDAWKKQDESYTELYQITFGKMRKADKDLKEQQEKARDAEEKIRKERLLTGQNTLQAKIDDARSLEKVYNLEVTNAEGNAAKLLAIQKAWDDRLLAARRTSLNAQAALAMQKADESYRNEAMRWDDSTKKYVPKVEEETLAKLEAKRDADKARIQKDLQTDLANLTDTTRIAMTRLSREAADQARNDALTILDAQTNARSARLQLELDEAQRVYRKQMEMAERAGKNTYDIEVKYGRDVRDAKLALANQQTLDAVQAATNTYNRTKQEMEKRGADTGGLTTAFNEQLVNIREGGSAQKSDLREEQIRQEKEARQAVSRIRAENNQADAQNALDALQNQLAKGAIAWEKAETQRLAATLRSIEAQRVIEVTGAEGNQTRINQINKRYATLRQKEILDSEKETRERAKSANDTFEAVQLQELSNRLEKGKITRAQFEEENFSIRAASLIRNSAYEIRNTALTSEQKKALEAKLQQDLLKLEIDGINAREAAIIRAQDEEAALARRDAEQRFRVGKDTQEEFTANIRNLDEEALELRRQRALKVNKDGAEGASRIWRQYYLDLANLDVQAKNDDRQRTTAHLNSINNQNRASLQNQLSQGLVTTEEYSQQILDLELDRIDRVYTEALESGTKTSQELIDIFAEGELQKEALQLRARQESKDREEAHQNSLRAQEQQRLQISLSDRLISQQEFDDQSLKMEFDRIDRVYTLALESGQKSSTELIDIYEAGELEKEKRRAEIRERDRQREIAHETELFDRQKKNLELSLREGNISQAGYEQANMQLTFDRLDATYARAVKDGKMTSTQLMDLFNENEQQKDSMRQDYAEKQRARDQNLLTQQRESYKQSLNVQVMQQKMSVEERQSILDSMNEEALLNQYQNELLFGKKTTDELVLLWNNYLNSREMLSIQVAERERRRALEVEAALSGSNDKMLANRLSTGEIDVTEYERQMDESAKRAAERALKNVTDNPESDTDARTQAHTDYRNEIDRIDIAASRRIADRQQNDLLTQNSLYLTALQQTYEQGNMTFEAYQSEKLLTEKDSLKISRDLELGAVGLTEERKELIRQKYRLQDEKLEADSIEAKRQMTLRGEEELRQSRTESLERQYRAGLIETSDYLRERTRLQTEAIEARHTAEVKAAAGDANLIKAANERLDNARANLTSSGVQTEAQIRYSGFKTINDLEMGALEQLNNAKMISETNFMEQRHQLLLKDLEERRLLELAAVPETNVTERKKINDRFDQASKGMIDNHTRSMKDLNDQFNQGFEASNKLASQWNQNAKEIKELDRAINVETDSQKKHQLQLMKYGKIGEQIKMVADVLVSFASPALQAFTGMSAKVADEWAEDMTRMVEDVFDLGKSILIALGNGDWVTVAIKGLQIVANWFTRNAKAAKEAADATKEYNKQFSFSKDGTGYGSRTVNEYSTGILFWKTNRYEEKIDEEKEKLAKGLEGAVINGFQSGFAEAFKTGDITPIKKSIKQQLAQSVLQGMIDGFLKTEAVAKVIGPLIQELLDAAFSNDEARMDAAIANFDRGLDSLDGPMQRVADMGKRAADSLIPSSQVVSEAWRNVLDSAMNAMFKGDDPLQAMYDSIRSKLQDSIREGFIMKRVMEQLQPFFDDFDKAIKNGTDPSSALASINAALPGLALQVSTDLAPVLAMMNTYLPQALNANTSAVNANTNQMSKFQFQDTTIVNYEQIGGTSRVRSRLGVQL